VADLSAIEKGKALSRAVCPNNQEGKFGLDLSAVTWYKCTIMTDRPPIVVERVQTGVRVEKRLLKVLKGLAELKDLSLGDLLEGIVLHAFEGKAPFSPATLKEIEQLKKIYGLTLKASDSHQFREETP
jgi:hypothetical protein